MSDFTWDPDTYLDIMAEEMVAGAAQILDPERSFLSYGRLEDPLPNGPVDLVIPPDPADVVTPIDGVVDTPSSLADHLAWLSEAGLTPRVTWQHRDLAVVAADQDG